MPDCICLPLTALNPELWQKPDLGRLLLYLLSRVDSQGKATITSGEVYQALGIQRQPYRTLLQKLAATGTLTTIPTTNATTIVFKTQIVSIKKQPPIQPPIQPPSQPLQPPIKHVYQFVSPDFEKSFHTWLAYKKEQFNFTYKSERALKTAYASLVNLSDGDPAIAAAIVNQSMSAGWKGLFPLKKNGNQNNDTHNSVSANRQGLVGLAGEVLRAIADSDD